MSRRPLQLEYLEDRTMPATFGTPWADGYHLTLSFAPDGTAIAGHTSQLFKSLDAIKPAAVWQSEILRALETWAVHANISVGVVTDGGEPFGVTGLTQGDARFGDIRIGAQPMSPLALSVSVPPDPFVSGTWAGDVLLNSAVKFDGTGTDLYSVMLHEFGHALGLPDSNDPNSVMYGHATQPRNALAPSDVAAIRALYGVRTSFGGNETLATAKPIPYPSATYGGESPLVTWGDMTTLSDADFYSVSASTDDPGPMTFRLQTAGISLLEPRLTVYDASGNVLGTAQSTNLTGGTITVHLNSPTGGALYYIKVQGATQNVFGIGRYGLAVSFDNLLQVSPASIDAVLRGRYDRLPPATIEQIFLEPGDVLFGDNNSTNNSFTTAQPLTTPAGYQSNSHYLTYASLGEAGDNDYYKVQTPAASGQPVVLTASVNSVGTHGVNAQIQLFDGSQKPVSARVLVNGYGLYTIQATGLLPDATYYLRVGAAAGELENVGNYSLAVDFHDPTTLLTKFTQGALDQSKLQKSGTVYVAQNQLFQFTLSASAPNDPIGTAVQMTIVDSHGHTVFNLTANAGDTVSGNSLFLVPGAYTVTFTVVQGGGALTAPVDFELDGTVLSDPIGPVLKDPTLKPKYICPTDPTSYCYPNGKMTKIPYFLAL
jgi:hypothetical protein